MYWDTYLESISPTVIYLPVVAHDWEPGVDWKNKTALPDYGPDIKVVKYYRWKCYNSVNLHEKAGYSRLSPTVVDFRVAKPAQKQDYREQIEKHA